MTFPATTGANGSGTPAAPTPVRYSLLSVRDSREAVQHGITTERGAAMNPEIDRLYKNINSGINLAAIMIWEAGNQHLAQSLIDYFVPNSSWEAADYRNGYAGLTDIISNVKIAYPGNDALVGSLELSRKHLKELALIATGSTLEVEA